VPIRGFEISDAECSKNVVKWAASMIRITETITAANSCLGSAPLLDKYRKAFRTGARILLISCGQKSVNRGAEGLHKD